MKKQKLTKLYEYAGWIGVLFVLGSYALLVLELVDGQSPLYHALILAGSALVAVISYKKRAYQPMTLNIVFTVLALAALIRIVIT